MDEEKDLYLVAGLGNPGSAYEKTRHNIGFYLVKEFAKKHGFVFRHASHFIGELAQGRLDGKKVLLLLPMTYMNSSGEAIKKCVDFFKIGLEQLLVLSDDVALPFGHLRLKAKGSAGGHNGLKSVEEHLSTQNYPRLRIGIGDNEHQDLAAYVLGSFNPSEWDLLPEIAKKVGHVIETWIFLGISAAMQEANTALEKESF